MIYFLKEMKTQSPLSENLGLSKTSLEHADFLSHSEELTHFQN